MTMNGLSKADQAHQHVLNGITSGQYKPGDRLVLSTIANELGMSVVPVREAIRRLQTDNLVQFERNVGATVTGIDPIEYHHTMETLVWWYRSEENTSELQSRGHIVCSLLLVKYNI